MKSMSKILTAALITTTLAAAPAMAGSVGASVGGNAGVDVDAGIGSSTGVTTGVAADLSGNANAAGQAGGQVNLIALIEHNATVASEIQTMIEADAVTVVRVEPTADASTSAIEQAVKENRDAVDDLQTSLRANAALSSKLEAEGVNIASVVAAEAGANGALTVYVR